MRECVCGLAAAAPCQNSEVRRPGRGGCTSKFPASIGQFCSGIGVSIELRRDGGGTCGGKVAYCLSGMSGGVRCGSNER